MAFLTVTLNAAIDATYVVEGFAHGGHNRVIRRHAMPGGKGNNVARVLTDLGEDVVATGFVGGAAGRRIEDGLREAGVDPHFTWLASGESRTCHTILEHDTGVATEILEPGPKVAKADRDGFLRVLPDYLRRSEVVVISGSAPPGATPGFLARLAKSVRRRHSWTDRKDPRPLALDASGPALQALLDARPDILKPNEDEIRQLMGRAARLHEQIAFVRDDLIGSRLPDDAKVILSRGREGAILVTESGAWRAKPPEVQVVNTVGCGDALLAGFISAWHAGASDADALRSGVASGTAAALQEVAGKVRPRDMASIRTRVEVTEVMP